MKKKNKTFELSYLGIKQDEYAVVYHKMGDYSVTIAITNNIQKFSADETLYYQYHSTFSNIIKLLGEGYSIQMHDIFSEKEYTNASGTDFLSKEFFNHFKGRKYKTIHSYLTITKNVTRSAFFQYNSKEYKSFNSKIGKILSILNQERFHAKALNVPELELFIKRFLAMEFDKPEFSLQNFKVTNERIEFGEEVLRSVSLVDIDHVNMPVEIKPYSTLNINSIFPVDLFSFLYEIPDCKAIIYHQYIQIPNQRKEIHKLEAKRKKHSGVPDPANDYAVEDIDNVLYTIARTNDFLVYSHFNFLMYGFPDGVNTAINTLENKLFEHGIIPSHNDYNQKELYVSTFPGHTWDLKNYNKFFTTTDVSLSLLYKESLMETEDSDFQIYYTDRAGVPIAIDTSDLPMETGRIVNRNKFVLGPSGSGKSFYMNTTIKQYFQQDTDVILVDTGHSYKRLCEFFNGEYITYSEDKPITMNPFLISRKEYNEEKREFIIGLTGLLWKGADATLTQLESSILSSVVTSYYNKYFNITNEHKVFSKEEKKQPWYTYEIKTLNFNSFYEYSILKIKDLITSKSSLKKELQEQLEFELSTENLNGFNKSDLSDAAIAEKQENYYAKQARIRGLKEQIETEDKRIASEKLPIKVEQYSFILKKFYKGGEYDQILNSKTDSSLFDKKFIVFEIDNIKDNKLLFPIVTIIIMDVFLQKMRLKNGRKVLIIEEAWKAIASPMMASYILYVYKTVRKFFGEAILVTQELDDIIGNEIVKNSVLANSDTIILLDQAKFKENYSEVSSLLSLNEIEQRKIFTINALDNKFDRGKFKEVYIKRGSTGEVYGVEVSLAEYLTYTTEKKEKTAIDYYVAQHETYEESLVKFMSDFKSSKLSLGKFVNRVNSEFNAVSIYAKNHNSFREGLRAFNEDLNKSNLSIDDFISKVKEQKKIKKVAV